MVRWGVVWCVVVVASVLSYFVLAAFPVPDVMPRLCVGAGLLVVPVRHDSSLQVGVVYG